MSLVRLDDVSLAYGEQKLLVQVGFEIDPGERVCLIGRNGTGKTSLFRLITGIVQPDSGLIQYRSGLVMSTLDQALPQNEAATVREVVAEGLAELKSLVTEYEQLAHQNLDKAGMKRLDDLQHRIDELDGWSIDQRVELMMAEMALPPDQPIGELSGGWRRRVGLAKALISKPDLLLLDEPTNHLDIVTIQWLENRIRSWPGAVLFITHDRAFLDKLATRICELDRGRLLSFPGSYDAYLERKEKLLEDEATANKLFDKKLDDEEIWIRQGVKARRHRNQNRVRRLEGLRQEHADRLTPLNRARISIEAADQSGRKVIEAKHISHGFRGEELIKDFSCKIMRGDRIGLLGNNGVGKSTLLRILLGEIVAQHGMLKTGTALEIGYFGQLRESLDPEKSVAYIVGNGSDYVKINGHDRHVIGYLRGFLFSAKRAMTPVKSLSGGERNRVILARLFTKPTNFLILDEPTNDLDVETLEVLEDRLDEYKGTLIVVSHDRMFLDSVVTSVFAFEPRGHIARYVGGYNDWLRQGKPLAETDNPHAVQGGALPASAAEKRKEASRQVRKLSYKDQRELDSLAGRIEVLEGEIKALDRQTGDRGFYDKAWHDTVPVLDALRAKQAEHEQVTARWLELEEQKDRA
ncbi:MAG: ATP-binding cassette domain-containing protein [Gammaproteobacteria bacterium]|nr:ATP-binding cassette domain-containing protein [Gammaproteobacteria bacterium]